MLRVLLLFGCHLRPGAVMVRRGLPLQGSLTGPSAPHHCYLVVTTRASLAGTGSSPRSQPVLIGRADDSTLVLTDDYASTRHAWLSQRGSDWFVGISPARRTALLGPVEGDDRGAGPISTPVHVGRTVIETLHDLALRYAARSDQQFQSAPTTRTRFTPVPAYSRWPTVWAAMPPAKWRPSWWSRRWHPSTTTSPVVTCSASWRRPSTRSNSAIAEEIENPDLEGMGTALTAILFASDQLGLVHIGDSRGYLLQRQLAQITKDDIRPDLGQQGRITCREAHSRHQRSLIMRALTGHEVRPTLINH